MTTLIVYYSLTGTTRTVATALAKELAADIEEIGCDRYSPGFWGFLRAGYDSWKGHLPAIGPLSHAPSRYELVVVGGPMWASHIATPVRAFLRQEASRLPSVAYVLTQGGSAPERALREMQRLTGLAPKATLVVRQADVKKGDIGPAISSFASMLRKSKAA